jgi:predicted ester cyclase
MMSDLKKILSRALENVWSEGDVGSIEEIYHPDFVMHFTPIRAGDESILTYSELPGDVTQMKTSFPDFREVVHDFIREGDQVVARLTLSGTQVADYQGFRSHGKRFEIDSIDIYRFAGDRIIEQWGVMDIAAMRVQLGWS